MQHERLRPVPTPIPPAQLGAVGAREVGAIRGMAAGAGSSSPARLGATKSGAARAPAESLAIIEAEAIALMRCGCEVVRDMAVGLKEQTGRMRRVMEREAV